MINEVIEMADKQLSIQEYAALSKEERHDYYSKLSSDAEREEYDQGLYLYQTDNRTALSGLLNTITAEQKPKRWATGFKSLDDKLSGGFKGDKLIFLGAISSLGKTSFALQIATQLAEAGEDVLVFSLEMSKNELNAKTISRYTHILTQRDKYRMPYRLTQEDIENGDIGEVTNDLNGVDAHDQRGQLFLDAYRKAEAIADRMRIFVGYNDINVDKVRHVVDLHIQTTRRKPFVVCDYLQILRPSEQAGTGEKRLLTDYDVTTLKTIARDFDIPVLVISAFNRDSYLQPVSMSSFRESSGIEYSSDILLAMQYQGMDYQRCKSYKDQRGKLKRGYENRVEHDTRVRDLLHQMEDDGANGKELPVELRILKNSGGVKGTLYFHFLPAYSYFSEQKAETFKLSEDDYIFMDDVNFFTDSDTPAPALGETKNGVTIGKKVL